MIKPSAGYVLCGAVVQEKVGGVYLPTDVNPDENENKELIVKELGEGAKRAKKGDIIILKATAIVSGARDGEDKYAIVEDADIIGTKK